MLKRQYPIMMGLGTKILTAYHHPNFKNGLMFAILDSKKKFPRGHNVSNDELKQSMSTVRAEIYFSDIDTLDGFIKHLKYERDLWAKKIEKKMKYSDVFPIHLLCHFPTHMILSCICCINSTATDHAF